MPRMLVLITALSPLACGDAEDPRGDTVGLTGVTSVTGASGITLGTSASDSTPTGGQGSESGGVGGSESTGGAGDTGIKLDLADLETEGVAPCSEYWSPAKQAEIFQYIWIANSAEGTVSKIDTRTGDEIGRYRVAPGESDPSRT